LAVGFEEHPAVARRRVRLALRRARAEAGISQGEVAERLTWSLSKVQRIELGEVTVSVTDLRALADLYGTITPERFAELAGAARIARRSRWSIAPEYRDSLTPALIDLMGYEAHAHKIEVYQPVLVPGVLQTPEMADFILAYWKAVLETPERRRIRHEVRMLRRTQVIERANAPTYRLVLDESVLSRVIGGRSLMADQLEALEKFADMNRVHIRVLPLAEGGLMGLLGPFTLVSLDDDAIVYRETWSSDEIVDDARAVDAHSGYFAAMWEEALDEEKSLRLIRAKATNLRSDMDRYGP
jgi:transcriptional regulator with XRE-family HTH domain